MSSTKNHLYNVLSQLGYENTEITSEYDEYGGTSTVISLQPEINMTVKCTDNDPNTGKGVFFFELNYLGTWFNMTDLTDMEVISFVTMVRYGFNSHDFIAKMGCLDNADYEAK